MPGDYHYFDSHHLFVTVYWGRISLVDILDTILRRTHDPDIAEARANVIDLSHATWTEIPPQYVRSELDRLRPALGPPKLPTVFVTPGEFFYGFARMYALMQVIYGAAKVTVVRSWNEASAAVGFDLEEARAWAMQRAPAGLGEDTVAVRPGG